MTKTTDIYIAPPEDGTTECEFAAACHRQTNKMMRLSFGIIAICDRHITFCERH